MNSTSSFIYNILEWITRFAYLNFLWIVFSLLGAVVFGFFPSTLAMFAVSRDWLRGNTGRPVFQSFWKYYRRDFVKSNLLGLFITLIAGFIAVDLFYIQASSADLSWTYIPLFAFMFLFVMYLFYLFPTFVHYDLKVGQIIKNAFLIMLINPINSFIIFLCLGSIAVIMQAVPALAVIFGGSIYAFITTWIALRAFNRVDGKNDLTETEEI